MFPEGFSNDVLEQTEIQIKYSGYIEKEKNNADKLNRLEYVEIPKEFDFHQVKSLSFEAREKMTQIKPATIAQYLVLGCFTIDISVLLVFLGRCDAHLTDQL